MKSLDTQNGLQFFEFLSVNYPELRSTFPGFVDIIVDIQNKLIVPKPEKMTEKQYNEYLDVLNNWLNENEFTLSPSLIIKDCEVTTSVA